MLQPVPLLTSSYAVLSPVEKKCHKMSVRTRRQILPRGQGESSSFSGYLLALKGPRLIEGQEGIAIESRKKDSSHEETKGIFRGTHFRTYCSPFLLPTRRERQAPNFVQLTGGMLEKLSAEKKR